MRCVDVQRKFCFQGSAWLNLATQPSSPSETQDDFEHPHQHVTNNELRWALEEKGGGVQGLVGIIVMGPSL